MKRKTKPKSPAKPKPKPKPKPKRAKPTPSRRSARTYDPPPAALRRLLPASRRLPPASRTPPLPLPPPHEDDLPPTGDEDVLIALDAEKSAISEELAPEPPPVAAPEAAPTELTRYEIKHDLIKRLDIYLRDRIPHASRATLQKLIKSGAVTVNARLPKSSTILRAGDVVELVLPKSPASRGFVPENIPLDIIYEDDGFIALNKQAGLIVHPARGHWSGTLINALMFHSQQTGGGLSTGSDPWRPGIIHRLDRDTTGLILVAKTDEAHWRIAGQFERRTIKKTYLAIVHGEFDRDSDLIDAPLAVNAKIREKYAVRKDIGRPAQTVYIVKERFKGYTLLELHPKTGRTHQLRVHCAYIHHPIVGDTMYGGRQITLADIVQKPLHTHPKPGDAPPPLITRQALHAYRLQLVHPTNFTRQILEAPPPPDIANLLTLLRQHRKA